MTRNITHVHATKNSTELPDNVHVDPIVKFKVSKKSDWLIDRTTHFPREYKKHTIGEEKTKLLSEISTKKLENSMTRIWRNTLQRKWEVQMAQYEPKYEKFLLPIVRV